MNSTDRNLFFDSEKIWKNVTLELSLKPFTDDSDETMRRVFYKLFRQWRDLWEKAEQISMLFWIADGSEILEFSGDLEQKFEWAYWQGIANPPPCPNPNSRAHKISTNYFPVKYRADAVPRSYAWLKHLLEICREIGFECTGKRIRLGATFDNGPEFSISDFKYHRHKEIAQAHSIYLNSFVTCNSRLHADPTHYAAYPDGIPEGLSLGSFLGGQYREFAAQMGFDYIWLSNGMGFGTDTWGIIGALFDKHAFYPERRISAENEMKQFWLDFLAAAPGAVIETRGSNYSAGMEMATDAAPLAWLYKNRIIAPPVNSPAAAIRYNPGLSMSAYLSHIAELPAEYYTFRYYIHDPWFLNSPWLDRYGREPWDIYMPLAATRINENNQVETAGALAFLTCDDSFGRMPDQVPEEVIPIIRTAWRERPDCAGPFLLVYPFREYTEGPLDAVFTEEMFLAFALQNAAPVNTVISTGIFLKLLRDGVNPAERSVPVIPLTALENDEIFAAVSELAKQQQILCYGSLHHASERVCSLLGLTRSKPFSGEVRIPDILDTTEKNGISETCHVLPLFDCGGLEEVSAGAETVLETEIAGEKRVLISRKNFEKGGIVFVRALLPCKQEQLPENLNGSFLEKLWQKRHLMTAPPSELFPSGSLLRMGMNALGWRMSFHSPEPEDVPILTISRHNGAFIWSGFVPCAAMTGDFSTPFGIPIPFDSEIRVGRNRGTFYFGKTIRFICRVFVRQEADSIIKCQTSFPSTPRVTERFTLCNLKNAEVRVFPHPACADENFDIAAAPGSSAWWSDNYLTPEWEETPCGRCLIFRNISGSMNIAWKIPDQE